MGLPSRSGQSSKETETTNPTNPTNPTEESVAELKAKIAAMEKAQAGSAEKPPEEKKKAPDKSKTKEVAPTNAAGGDVVVSDGIVMPTIASLKDKMDPETFGNVFPRMVGANGNLSCGDVKFGTYVDVQVFSHSERWFVVPEADDSDKDANKFCRASYDGKTIPGRDDVPAMTIDEYKESMSDTYESWSVKKYHDLYCVIFNAEKEAEKGAALGFVQVSCSPTAVKLFNAFSIQTGLFVARGAMKASHQNCMRITGDLLKTDAGKEYVRMSFSPVPLDVLESYTPALTD